MNGRTLGFLLTGLAVAGPACAQGRHQGPVVNRPPVAGTPAEKKILGVLDQMVSRRRAVPGHRRRQREDAAPAGRDRGGEERRRDRDLHRLLGAVDCLALQSTGGKLKTFEIDPGRAEQARKHFAQAGVDGLVEVVVGDAHENVKRLKDPIDLLFLDADKEGYASYLQTLLPLVRPGGLITADNVAMAPDYVKAVTTDPQLDTVFFGRFAVTLKKR